VAYAVDDLHRERTAAVSRGEKLLISLAGPDHPEHFGTARLDGSVFPINSTSAGSVRLGGVRLQRAGPMFATRSAGAIRLGRAAPGGYHLGTLQT
jgi:hypothetical protein